MNLRALPGMYDHRTGAGDILAEGMTVAEMYSWAPFKRAENLLHIAAGHDRRYGRCPLCDNCACGALNVTPLKSFVCRCAEGKRQVSPYRIRFQNRAELERKVLIPRLGRGL